MQHNADCSSPLDAHSCSRLAVIGAGPIGLELALCALQRGMSVAVFESGESACAHVLAWQHVTLFSPWSMNTSDAGRRVLETLGLQLPHGGDFPTGGDFCACYLQPLAKYISTHPACSTWSVNAHVLSVGRGALLKGESIGGGDLQMPRGKPQAASTRALTPFRLLVRHGGSSGVEKYHEGFDFVCDCSGCYRLRQ